MYANNGYAGSRSNAISAYQSATQTVSPAQAIVMLYDGAIQRIGMARDAIAADQIETRYNAVMKAYAIIQGLQSHLDYEAGGDIAQQLNRYYEYLLVRMTMINLKNDAEICNEVIDRLREMRASWAEIAQGGTSEGSNPSSSDAPFESVVS